MRPGALTFILLTATAFAVGCGEHPCTLHVGEPAWCSVTPDDVTPFCAEVCEVCDEVSGHRHETACRARCREEAGISERMCEELDPAVEASYRSCIESSDYGPCVRHRDGSP